MSTLLPSSETDRSSVTSPDHTRVQPSSAVTRPTWAHSLWSVTTDLLRPGVEYPIHHVGDTLKDVYVLDSACAKAKARKMDSLWNDTDWSAAPAFVQKNITKQSSRWAKSIRRIEEAETEKDLWMAVASHNNVRAWLREHVLRPSVEDPRRWDEVKRSAKSGVEDTFTNLGSKNPGHSGAGSSASAYAIFVDRPGLTEAVLRLVVYSLEGQFWE